MILAEFVNAAMLGPIRFAYERSPTARQDKIREHRAILRCINARDAEGARRAMLASLNDALHKWSGFPARDPEQLSPVARSEKRSSKASATRVAK
jgi:DNA-binding FadR family transcriptional regulator